MNYYQHALDLVAETLRDASDEKLLEKRDKLMVIVANAVHYWRKDTRFMAQSGVDGVTVEWADNPLASRIVLDDYGRLLLRYAIAKDAIHSACVLIHMDKTQDPPSKGRWVDQFDFSSEDIEAQITRTAEWCEKALLDVHCGDCTCVPATCIKCYAEEFIHVNTIHNLGKHPGHYVECAFGDGRTTLEEALHWMRTEPIKATWAGWEVHAPRWKQERDAAIEWLERYGREHDRR